MRRRNQMLMSLAVLAIIGVSMGLLALFRVQQAEEFSRPYSIQMTEGTNYVLRVLEVAIGKADTACVLIVYLRLENPNPFDLMLERRSFFLADRHRTRYRPVTTGTQNELIKLPANGVLEREMLSFTLPDDVFAGRVALLIGDRRNRIVIKDETPFFAKLRDGEFRSFRRSKW